jgi:glycosyltransferase involved in cell wall biosynthesis
VDVTGRGRPDGLTIGFLGRVPPPLGGAGLELQIARTAAALEGLGHRVLAVEAAHHPASFDVLHAFGTEPAVWHHLRHWTRNRAPLVVTAVLVVSPGREELVLRASARLPAPMTSGRMKADVLRHADAVIAATEYERRLATRLGADPLRVAVIGNAADPKPVDDGLPDGVPDGPFALMVGAVSPRKRQEEVLGALAGRLPVVVVGGWAGPPSGRAAWERAVRESGAVWLGEIADSGALAALERQALALVHLSAAEVQSLAVLEALAHGTPAVLSDIPSHRELSQAHPGWVRIVRRPEQVPGALDALRARPPEGAPAVPAWADVARALEDLYRRVLAEPRGGG